MTPALNEFEPSAALLALDNRRDELVRRFFVPVPLVQPGRTVELTAVLKDSFDSATALFRQQRYREAQATFERLKSEAESISPGAGRTAAINAAACAAWDGNYQAVLDALTPMFFSNRLFGLPLWNFALALHRVGRTEHALDAIELWLKSADHPLFRFRGRLVAATLASTVGQRERALAHMQAAMDDDAAAVARELRPLAPASLGSTPDGTVTDAHDPRSAALRATLGQLVRPKRPTRSHFASMLSGNDLSALERVLEKLGESDTVSALEDLSPLTATHGKGTALDLLEGVALLFGRRDEEAHAILSSTLELNPHLRNGFNLWNLACAQVRTGRVAAAESTLAACAETEFRSSPALAAALDLLRGKSTPDVHTQIRPATSPKHLTDTLPVAPHEARLELLRRLIRPKRLASGYRPDLKRLTQRHLREIERTLEATRHYSASSAAQVLIPLSREHPSVYTLKAHAASCVLLSDSPDRVTNAQLLLRDAERLRELDSDSRMNLAYCQCERGDYAGVVSVLSGAQRSGLADSHRFWLTLSIAQAVADDESAGRSAAKALTLAPEGAAKTEVLGALSACDIEPVSVAAADPIRHAAHLARAAIERSDLADSLGILRALWKLDPDFIPELGRGLLEPRFIGRPGAWGAGAVEAFAVALQAYLEDRAADAAELFARLFNRIRVPSIAVNAVAAYLKANEPNRAAGLLSGAVRRRLAAHSRIGWMVTYNVAIAQSQLGHARRAAQLLQQQTSAQRGRRLRAPLRPLLVYVCTAGLEHNPELIEVLADALEGIRRAADPPSDELLAVCAWANLSRHAPSVTAALDALSAIVDRESKSSVRLPTDIGTARDLRSTYLDLSQRSSSDTVSYLQSVIAARQNDRHHVSGVVSQDRVVRSIGVELAARICLVDALSNAGQRDEAFAAIEDAEGVLLEKRHDLPPGFLAMDWADLAKCALTLRLPWAAARFVESGLEADPERPELLRLRDDVLADANPAAAAKLRAGAERIAATLPEGGAQIDELVLRVDSVLKEERLDTDAPRLAEQLRALLGGLQRSLSGPDLEELTERAWTYARLCLPADAAASVSDFLSRIAAYWGPDSKVIPLDIRVHDDTIWPRADQREACCVLSVSRIGEQEVAEVAIRDADSGETVWQGHVQSAQPVWLRWILQREDEFAPGEFLDVRLDVSVADAVTRPVSTLSLPVVVADRPPAWPSFPTGALTPDDVVDLYGRADILHQVTRSLSPKRSMASFFLEAPRQMGKTSILRFLETMTPPHVLPVYVNLERSWNSGEGPNLWGWLARCVVSAANSEALPLNSPVASADQFVAVVHDVCRHTNREYVWLLLDEFRMLLADSAGASAVLSELRAFHDNPKARVSFLAADRLTRGELQARVDHDLWSQLTPRTVEPLDEGAIGRALTTPTIGQVQSDVVFLPDTIRALHSLTAGYPYHVIRVATAVVDRRLLDGPWLVALPSDIDAVVQTIVDQDDLFQMGLCRPDRIDRTLEDAMAGFLEFSDLRQLVDELRADPEWRDVVSSWEPRVRECLAGLGYPDELVTRLVAVGVARETEAGTVLFSPILELWLRRMRAMGRRLGRGSPEWDWSVSELGDGSKVSASEWQDIDHDLMTRCERSGRVPPLALKGLAAGDWQQVVAHVDSAASFDSFSASVFRVFIDGRADAAGLRAFPRLFLAYHSIRLARNYHVHRSRNLTAVRAWNQICTRAFRRPTSAYQPTRPEEWTAIRNEILRMLYTAYKSAVAALEQQV